MSDWLHVFTPETWIRFREHGSTLTGFAKSRRRAAERIRRDDRFICYTAKTQCWTGILVVESDLFVDRTPIFKDRNDPYCFRFRVKPIVVTDLSDGIPVRSLWSKLIRTSGVAYGERAWAYKAHLAISPSMMDERDTEVIADALIGMRGNVELEDSVADARNQGAG